MILKIMWTEFWSWDFTGMDKPTAEMLKKAKFQTSESTIEISEWVGSLTNEITKSVTNVPRRSTTQSAKSKSALFRGCGRHFFIFQKISHFAWQTQWPKMSPRLSVSNIAIMRNKMTNSQFSNNSGWGPTNNIGLQLEPAAFIWTEIYQKYVSIILNIQKLWSRHSLITNHNGMKLNFHSLIINLLSNKISESI